MSRWDESTEWPYWFITSRGGKWWVCVKSGKDLPTKYMESFPDKLTALKSLHYVRGKYAASAAW